MSAGYYLFKSSWRRVCYYVADGLRVQPPSMLVGLITETWGTPAGVIADRFRVSRLGGRWPTC